MSTQSQHPDNDKEMPLLTHLIELRQRLLRAVIAVTVIFLSLIYFANDIYTIVSRPLAAALPEGAEMIATGVIAPFFTPFKLTLVVSIFLSIPVILHQIWGFISPALYQHERRFAVPLLVSSIVLFYLGMVFAYIVVFPIMFEFFPSVIPDGIRYTPDMTDSLNIMLKLFFAFGIAFEVPVATVLMIWSGLTTVDSLKEKRPYIFVGAFVIGMLLTPPDIISQTLLALPMWLLFEAGIWFASFIRVSAREQNQ